MRKEEEMLSQKQELGLQPSKGVGMSWPALPQHLWLSGGDATLVPKDHLQSPSRVAEHQSTGQRPCVPVGLPRHAELGCTEQGLCTFCGALL